MLHRDIKPCNLMVETSGSLKLLDLGLVGFHAKRSSSSLTMAGRDVILGTADYVSPEQALDSHGADIRSDIYSLGCVLYFLLTGAPPFAGKSAAEKLISHQTGTPKPIQKLAPDVPDELAKVLDRMMAKDPDDRFQTPQEVQEAVQPFAERVNPAYDPSLLRYTRESIDQLIRYGAEAINSSHRLTASMQGVSLRPEYGGSETSQSYASLSSGSVPISQPTTPNPAATIETVTHATMTPPQHSAPAPQPPVETPGDAPTPPPTQSAAPPKKSRWLPWMVCLLTVGGGITAGLTYYGPHHTRASDSLDPNDTNKTKTIVLE